MQVIELYIDQVIKSLLTSLHTKTFANLPSKLDKWRLLVKTFNAVSNVNIPVN